MAYSSLTRLPQTDTLIAALTALRLGSFSAAAIELGITHAAVSRRIAVVEEWAGERLFERHGRGVLPTPNGQRILTRIGVALDQIALLGHVGKVRRKLPTVRLSVTPSFARYWLFPRVTSLEGQPPTVRLEIVAGLTSADLRGGEVDLAIRYGRGNWKVGTEQKLYDETLIPVVARSLHQGRSGVQAGDIAKWPLLHASDATNWKAWMAAHGQSLTTKGSDRVLADYAITLDAALAGLGVALWIRELHGLPEGLVAFDKFPAKSPLGYYLLSRAGDVDSPASGVASRILAAR